MKLKGKKKRAPGTTLTVSKRAHQRIAQAASKANPKRSIREEVNVMTGLPINE